MKHSPQAPDTESYPEGRGGWGGGGGSRETAVSPVRPEICTFKTILYFLPGTFQIDPLPKILDQALR